MTAIERFVREAIGRGVAIKSAVMEYCARTRGLLVTRLSDRLLLVEPGGRAPLGFAGMNGPHSTVRTRRICDNKVAARQHLAAAGLSVAVSRPFEDDEFEQAVAYLGELGAAVVVKPSNMSRGRGVTTNVMIREDLDAAWARVIQVRPGSSTRVVIEKLVEGNDYRVIVVGDRLVSASLRVRANVIGDGESTVRELIRAKNKLREANPHLAGSPIPEDITELDLLAAAGLDLDYVPGDQERLTLRSLSNVSRGGDNVDVTDEVHPDFRDIAVRAIAAIPGLKYGGVDIITADISLPVTTYVVSEVEFSPGPGPHFPFAGQPRDVGGAILEHYLAGGLARAGTATSRQPRPTLRRGARLALRPGGTGRSGTPATRLPVKRSTHHPRWRLLVPLDPEREVGFDTGQGGNGDPIQAAYGPGRVSSFANSLTRQSDQLTALLASYGIPCCQTAAFTTEEWDRASSFVTSIAGPYTVAPLPGRNERLPRSSLRRLDQVESEWLRLAQRPRRIVVAQAPQRVAADLLLVNGSLLAIVLRLPATVVGDGVTPLAALVERKAEVRQRNPYLSRFPLPNSVLRLDRLRRRGIDAGWVPRRRQVVEIGSSPLLGAAADTIGLDREPTRGLSATASRILPLLADPPVAMVSFAARSTGRLGWPTGGRLTWFLAGVELDPSLGRFVWPAAGRRQTRLLADLTGRLLSAGLGRRQP